MKDNCSPQFHVFMQIHNYITAGSHVLSLIPQTEQDLMQYGLQFLKYINDVSDVSRVKVYSCHCFTENIKLASEILSENATVPFSQRDLSLWSINWSFFFYM